MPAERNSRAQHQILDGGAATLSLAAGATATIQAEGTVWPMLPGQAARIFHASMTLTADAPAVVKTSGVQVQLEVEASTGEGVNPNSSLFLACAGFQENTFVGNGAGICVGASGDPLIQLAAGFIVAGLTTPGAPAQFQMFALADVTNTDAVNPHDVFVNFGALLAFLTLSP